MIDKKQLANGRNYHGLLIAVTLATCSSQVLAGAFEQCLLQQALEGGESMTLAEIRAICQGAVEPEKTTEDHVVDHDPSEGAFEDRIKGEESAANNPFVILPHKPNYALPVSYNWNLHKEPYKGYTDNYMNTEFKFQLSFKAPLWEGIFKGYGDLYVAYTNTSWWQAYNKKASSPFRETNHEPEAFFLFPMEQDIFGLTLRGVMAGIVHQSNGRTGDLSRSWNRVYANFLFEKGGFFFSIKPWLRIKEQEKDVNDPDYPNTRGDDNPDIEEYMGSGELYFGYRFANHHVTMMVRNNLRSENKGAAQVDWSFPLTERFRGYVQYFNGYGESLIDYNASVNRLSLGVMLTDWL